jgi:alpha-glucosidase (family GH31 glycosyl hydrolase)
MSAHGIRVLSWAFPVISEKAQAGLMPEVPRADLPVLRTRDPWQHVDFSNPHALELMRRWWKQRLDAGVAGSMVDFGDRVTEDAVFHNGQRGDEMHNFYSYGYHKTYSEVFRERRGDDFILFGRAAAPGTQKWVAQFGGDHPSNFRGLGSVLTGALNLSSCGFSTWGSDLGGFLGWPEPAVYMRWTQFGCFSPLMRCHGRTPREPWNYGDAAVANYKYFAWVRENLLDYIYGSAIESHESGVPMMRSMAVAFPDEPSLADIADQYMFGRDLLVAPVLDGQNSRTIHFPPDRWTSLWDGKSVSGPANLKLDVPLNSIPVYLKSGAIVPVQLNPTLAFGESMSSGRVNALLVTPPGKTAIQTVVNIEDHAAGVTLHPTMGGFDIVLKGLSDTNVLMIYGARVRSVSVGNAALPKIEKAHFESMPPGWCVDPSINRTVIRPPAGQDAVERVVHIVLVE